MLKAQKELDSKMMAKGGIECYPFDMVKTAYLVELGEMLNEWQGFKYWKSNKKVSKKDLLIEFADCLHFALSIHNNYEAMQIFYTESYWENFFTRHNELIKARQDKLYSNIFNAFNITPSLLVDLLTLAYSMDISMDELERAYYYKYNINLERVNGGY